MSTSTQAVSAQVPGRLGLLHGSLGSSTAETLSSPHPSLRETLASFGLPASTTTRQLYDLLLELDHECLHVFASDPAHDATSEVDSMVGLATYLSGPLSQCDYHGTSMFQEVQLRGFISSLALLQHNGVHTLDPDVFDKLKLKNISARFQKIAFQLHRSSTLGDKIRSAANVFVVQLASQYISFFNRGNSPWLSIFKPIKDIIFSALSMVSNVSYFE